MKRYLSLFLALAAPAFNLLADEPAPAEETLTEAQEEALIDEIIAQARRYLGSEAALNAVESIRYKGALIYGDGTSGAVEIVYKRPLYHQFTTMMNNFHEVSTLKKSEAWRLSEDVSQPGARSLEFYELPDIRQLQAGVREALGFYQRPTAQGSGVEYAGVDEADGIKLRVLVYYYSEGRVWFRRFFDAKTGRLVFTINEKGVGFEESGEIVASGVRFPKKLVTTFMTSEGEQAMELSYTSIAVNSDIDDKIFNMPLD